MDKCIGVLEIIREEEGALEPVSTIYKMIELPEYKQSNDSDKVILFYCLNDSNEKCFVAISVLDNSHNDNQFKKIIKRIKELSPFEDNCLLKVVVDMFKECGQDDIMVGIGLSSDLTSGCCYTFKRKE